MGGEEKTIWGNWSGRYDRRDFRNIILYGRAESEQNQ
jgi:hypothetical protein